MAPENPQRVRERVQHHTDVSLWFALLFLLGFGLVMIYSASSYTAFADYGDQMYYLKRQAISVGVGLIAMLIVAHIPYRFFAKFYVIGIFVSAVLIILVLSPLGVSSHGARRWIKIANGFPDVESFKLRVFECVALQFCQRIRDVHFQKSGAA